MGVEGGEVILSNIAGLGKVKSKMSSESGNEKGTVDAVSVQGQDRGQMPSLILTVNRNSMTDYAPR